MNETQHAKIKLITEVNNLMDALGWNDPGNSLNELVEKSLNLQITGFWQIPAGSRRSDINYCYYAVKTKDHNILHLKHSWDYRSKSELTIEDIPRELLLQAHKMLIEKYLTLCKERRDAEDLAKIGIVYQVSEPIRDLYGY